MEFLEYSRESRERLIDDPLRPYFIAWKRGCITKERLDELYRMVKAMVWQQIYSGWCSMDQEDMFQDVWAHIQAVLPKWDEESCTYVSTWLYLVISNWVKTLKIREKRLHDRVVYVEDMSKLNNIPDADETSDAVKAIRRCMDGDFDPLEMRIAQLIMEPTEDHLAVANSVKKYKFNRLSIADICSIIGITKCEYVAARERMKEKIRHEIDCL